ncbi:hypothetical protein QOZ80_3AG0227930 [Eleusine coracana subsp. coracana]|nr:hypothetical protein QOZ80_3AG0227930 [Eleusine coracana subsp. coracana]
MNPPCVVQPNDQLENCNNNYHVMSCSSSVFKITHFPSYHKSENDIHIAEQVFKEVINLHGMPSIVVSHFDDNFYNTYKHEVHPKFGNSSIFYISDLRPLLGERDGIESRTTLTQKGENDEDITPMDTHNTPPTKMKVHAHHLNLQVSSFLMFCLFDFENRLQPNELIIVKNHGDDDEIACEVIGGVMGQQGYPSQGGGPIKTDFESISEPRTSLH